MPNFDGYKFGGRRDADDIFMQMGQAHRDGMSFNAFQARAKLEGWSYRRGDMQADYRRYGAVDIARSPEARERARSWYDSVAAPLQRVMKKPFKAVVTALKEAKKGDDKRRAAIQEGLAPDLSDTLRAYLDHEGS